MFQRNILFLSSGHNPEEHCHGNLTKIPGIDAPSKWSERYFMDKF
jgi:hypothetical protein